MYYVSSRWRLDLNTWTPWHLVSSTNGLPLCEDSTWYSRTKVRTQSSPMVVDCEKCKESEIYAKSVQDYEKLSAEIGTKKSGVKMATDLVNQACFLADKYSVPFDTVYGLLFLRDFA